MRTVVQELINEVKQWMLDDEEVINNPLRYEEYMVMYANQMLKVKNKFIGMCELMLDKEKEQIMDAFEQGENNSVDYFVPDNNIKESEQYYNETFSK